MNPSIERTNERVSPPNPAARGHEAGACPHHASREYWTKACVSCHRDALQAAVQDVERQRDEFQQACSNEGHRAQREWDRAQALAAALEKVLACIRTTHVDMAGSTKNHYVLDSRRYAELTPEIRAALPPPQLSPGKEAAP